MGDLKKITNILSSFLEKNGMWVLALNNSKSKKYPADILAINNKYSDSVLYAFVCIDVDDQIFDLKNANVFFEKSLGNLNDHGVSNTFFAFQFEDKIYFAKSQDIFCKKRNGEHTLRLIEKMEYITIENVEE